MKSEFIEKKVFLSLLSDLKEDYKYILLISLETGLRLSDVLTLDYGTALGTRSLMEKKTNKSRLIVLPPYLRNIVFDRMLEREKSADSLVFPTSTAGSEGGTEKPYSRSTIYRAVKRAFADVPQNVTPHSARKIYAVELYRKTGDARSVKKALNHSQMDTTLLYIFSDKLQQFSD